MTTFQVDILNPKAAKLLHDLADLKLISIKQTSDDHCLCILNKLRSKVGNKPFTFSELTKEVESVRSKRYDKNKG